jgi:hypothetical protein
MSQLKKAGIALASTAVLMLASVQSFAADAAAPAADAGVKCVGGNACKGHGACKTANNSCKGMNGCKGQGWVMSASEQACTESGGVVEKAETTVE